MIGCSTHLSSSKLNINVEFQKIDAWLNLMPGSGHKFFIAGKYSVENNTDSTIKKMDLKQVNIYQDKKLIYSFVPLVTDVTMSESNAFSAKQTRNFLFGTDSGLNQKDDLNLEKNISAKFVFASDNKYYELTSENIKIEKVY